MAITTAEAAPSNNSHFTSPLVGGGPKTDRATVILGEYLQGKLNIRMDDLNGKKIVSFSV